MPRWAVFRGETTLWLGHTLTDGVLLIVCGRGGDYTVRRLERRGGSGLLCIQFPLPGSKWHLMRMTVIPAKGRPPQPTHDLPFSVPLLPSTATLRTKRSIHHSSRDELHPKDSLIQGNWHLGIV